MAITATMKNKIKQLKEEYFSLQKGKESLLRMIDEAEIPESVYNSNAIENSTLTLKDTEKILLDMELSSDFSLREVFEAKNLARVIEYLHNKYKTIQLNKETILLLHQMLIGNIDDKIAGRFRKQGEYVRVGTYIAPAPEHVESMIDSIIYEYLNTDMYFLEAIAKFHLNFETIHPFNDGNGRIGRILICLLLQKLNLPIIIIRDKEKQTYYKAFHEYRDNNQNTKTMEKVLVLALIESFHKRITYLKGEKIISLSEYIKNNKLSASAITNAARRQSIPAFREKGIWKISENFKYLK